MTNKTQIIFCQSTTNSTRFNIHFSITQCITKICYFITIKTKYRKSQSLSSFFPNSWKLLKILN